jgi:D-3-phosphoglycerate dehydrogenase / 2-oxoglutarate reductase
METVCIIDPIHPVGVDRIASGNTVLLPGEWDTDPRLAETTVIVIRTTDIGEELFARMPLLKAVVKHGAGVDNIDIAAASGRGAMVANTPGGENSTAVAEGAVALMLALLRQVREMDSVVREGRWDERWGLRLGDLTGARVGLIGFGRIAQRVASICANGFGCTVSAHDPFVADVMMRAAGAEPVSLAVAMACDVVSVHAPLTESTRGLIGAAELGLMPAHGIIVNCARGGIVDEAALAEVLGRKAIAGAAIDVFESEPPPAGHPLFGLPNALLSPHMAGVTEAGMKGMALHVAEVIETIAAGGVPATVLNAEALGIIR